jgi:hypothetical protein
MGETTAFYDGLSGDYHLLFEDWPRGVRRSSPPASRDGGKAHRRVFMPDDTKEEPAGRHVAVLKRGLLLFWAAWLSLVFTTNLLDGLKAAGLLPESWSFASGNYRFMCETTARYGTPAWLNGVLFAGVVCWEGLAAVLFGLAGLRVRSRRLRYTAFTAGLSLWGAFVLADEVFVAYAVEATHWRLFTALLATLLAVELLPEGKTRSNEEG